MSEQMLKAQGHVEKFMMKNGWAFVRHLQCNDSYPPRKSEAEVCTVDAMDIEPQEQQQQQTAVVDPNTTTTTSPLGKRGRDYQSPIDSGKMQCIQLQ
jgi:hypothetical protein